MPQNAVQVPFWIMLSSVLVSLHLSTLVPHALQEVPLSALICYWVRCISGRCASALGEYISEGL